MPAFHITVLAIAFGFFVYLSTIAFDILLFPKCRFFEGKYKSPPLRTFAETFLALLILGTVLVGYYLVLYAKAFGLWKNAVMVAMVSALVVWNPVCGFYIRLTREKRKGWRAVAYAILIPAGIVLCLWIGSLETP